MRAMTFPAPTPDHRRQRKMLRGLIFCDVNPSPPSSPRSHVDNDSSALAFNATLEELQMAEETTDGDLAKLEGGGYLASLGVYHELHCLVRLPSAVTSHMHCY